MVMPIVAAVFLVLTLWVCGFEMVHSKTWWPKDTWKGPLIAVPLFLFIVLVWFG